MAAGALEWVTIVMRAVTAPRIAFGGIVAGAVYFYYFTDARALVVVAGCVAVLVWDGAAKVIEAVQARRSKKAQQAESRAKTETEAAARAAEVDATRAARRAQIQEAFDEQPPGNQQWLIQKREGGDRTFKTGLLAGSPTGLDVAPLVDSILVKKLSDLGYGFDLTIPDDVWDFLAEKAEADGP